MARIPEYVAPRANLRPEEKGFSAYEGLARRLGPLANAASQDILRTGSARARGLEATGEAAARGIGATGAARARGLEAAAKLQAQQPLAEAEIAGLRSRLAFITANPGRGGGPISVSARARATRTPRTGSTANDLAEGANRLAGMTRRLVDDEPEGRWGDAQYWQEQREDQERQWDRQETAYERGEAAFRRGEAAREAAQAAERDEAQAERNKADLQQDTAARKAFETSDKDYGGDDGAQWRPASSWWDAFIPSFLRGE